jgi:hypothetical protein
VGEIVKALIGPSRAFHGGTQDRPGALRESLDDALKARRN